MKEIVQKANMLLYAIDSERLQTLLERNDRRDVLILKKVDYGKPALDKIRHEFKHVLDIRYNDKNNLEMRVKK